MKSGKLWCALVLTVGVAVTGCSGGTATPGTPQPAAASVGQSATPSGQEPGDTSAPTQSGGATSPTATVTVAALATVPANAVGFEVIDRAAMKQRWGMSDLDSSVDTNSPEFTQYLQNSRTVPLGPLDSYLLMMIQDQWGWSTLDVEWEAAAHGDGAPQRVYQLRDDLDMKVVIASLEKNGFTRSGPDERPFFRLEDLRKSGVRGFFAATVLPDKHLLITGEDPAGELGAIDDPTTSMVDNPVVGILLDGTPTPEFLLVSVGAGACSSALDTADLAGSPDVIKKKLAERVELTAGLHPMQGWAAMTVGQTKAVVTTSFASADDAQADADDRAALMATAESVVTGKPLSDIYTVTDTNLTGQVLRHDLTFASHAGKLANMIYSRDTPWAWCP